MASSVRFSRRVFSRRVLRGTVCGLALLSASCTVGPDYRRPALWSPSGWFGHDHPAPGDRQAVLASDVDTASPDPDWWSVFNDPELSALERRAAQSNLDVRIATARLAQSRAQLRETSADLYPGLSGTGSYTREKISDKLIQRGLQSAGSGLTPLLGSNAGGLQAAAGDITVPPLDLWKDGIDASWEIDLWGRVRREVESARATLVASAEDRRSVLIARLAEVARDYMMLRGSQALLAIAQANLASAEASLHLTQERYAGGLTTDLDVQNAASQRDSIGANIPEQQQQVARQINALSLLLGEPPQALSDELGVAQPVPPLPPRVPIGVPSELARRRPDIREAEAKLHAATASVGVAVADFYPKITLTGALNFESLELRDLSFWSAAAYTFGPSISLPIFQGGRLRGQLQLSKARQQEAAITYQKTVLAAWHDVDNALTAYAAEQRRHERLAQAVQSGQRALQLSQEQYRGGLQTFLNVLDAQRSLLSAQQQLADSTATQSTNLVQLYTALGGGWETVFPAGQERPGSSVAQAGTPPAVPAGRAATGAL